MAPKCRGKNHTPIKPLENSSLTFDESEAQSISMSKLKNMIKETMRMVDLVNLENKMEENMGHMESNIMGKMKNIAKLIQNLKENHIEGEDVSQGTREDKDNVHVDQHSNDKHTPR